MNWTLLDRMLAWLGWTPPAPAPTPRPRRARAICGRCHKDLAVVASTGLVWHHDCRPEFDVQAAALADAYRGEDGACVQQVVPSDAGMEGRR